MPSDVTLSAGQNVPAGSGVLDVRLRTDHQTGPDMMALLVGSDGTVAADSDFVFYNAPTHPTGSVALYASGLRLDPARVPPTVERIVVVANSDGAGGLLGMTLVVRTPTQRLSFTPPQLDELSTAVVLEFYRRAGDWRVRAVGQGWASGLAGLAREYGVAVDDEQDDVAEVASAAGPPASGTEVIRLVSERDALAAELARLTRQVQEARAALVETDERMLLQQVGYYQFRHPLDDVLASKQRLDDLRTEIKTAITKRTAVRGTSEWMLNGSLREGQALVRQFSDLMLRTYNIEADNCVRTVRAHTVDTAVKRLERTRQAIVENGRTMGVAIDEAFHGLRLAELKVTADHHLRVEQEREDLRAERQRQREEAKAQDEFKRRRKDLLKEQAHYQGLLDNAHRNRDSLAEAEARERLAEISEDIEDVEEKAANIRVGHVYVISNHGAFGERMVKIGMTRREDPYQRVHELGSASVPFRFDVHAMVFSPDAMGLERALHQKFQAHRVNRVNLRREFFEVGLAEVREALHELGGNHVVKFTEMPEASEWHRSLSTPPADPHPGVCLGRRPA